MTQLSRLWIALECGSLVLCGFIFTVYITTHASGTGAFSE